VQLLFSPKLLHLGARLSIGTVVGAGDGALVGDAAGVCTWLGARAPAGGTGGGGAERPPPPLLLPPAFPGGLASGGRPTVAEALPAAFIGFKGNIVEGIEDDEEDSPGDPMGKGRSPPPPRPHPPTLGADVAGAAFAGDGAADSCLMVQVHRTCKHCMSCTSDSELAIFTGWLVGLPSIGKNPR